MPVIYIRKNLYDTLVKMGKEPGTYVNELVEKDVEKKKTDSEEKPSDKKE